MLQSFKRLMLLVAVIPFSVSQALADWTLDADQSSLYFVSVKNEVIGELHHFAELDGTLSSQGKLAVDVSLASVDTMIPLRDERMRDILFNVSAMPLASVTAAIDPAKLAAVSAGDMSSESLSIEVSMHGKTKAYTVNVLVVGLEDGIVATTTSPILVNVADFSLGDGINELKTLAGLNSITSVVPVTATLVFK